VILSLYHTQFPAAAEQEALGEENLRSLSGTTAWTTHRNEINKDLEVYRLYILNLRLLLESFLDPVSKAMHLAMLDLATRPAPLGDAEVAEIWGNTVASHTNKGHHGIVYLLHEKALQHYPHPGLFTTQDMFDARRRFMDTLPTVMAKYEFEKGHRAFDPFDTLDTPLAIPHDMVEVPAAYHVVRHDERVHVSYRCKEKPEIGFARSSNIYKNGHNSRSQASSRRHLYC
jgi:hypothetical protein